MNSAYDRHVAFPSGLGNSTSKQLRSMSPMLIIPVGSTEQHGPHLPLDTDTRIATAVAHAVLGHLDGAPAGDWAVAPPVCYGASGEHEGFPGTVSIGTAALRLLLVEYGRSASSWASRLVFVNGHGGNVEALAAAVALLRHEGRDVGWVPCIAADADAHAGHTETSVLLHISPGDVASADLAPSELGVLGDPTTATTADGERIFAEMVDGCAGRMRRWQPDRNGLLL
ncbi:mycofactocin biosynthesis peptidyl-dipeptidase MftE [Mycolicibacterium sp. CBMA 295]|uniref:mycofactocin biosynthesis peptidyl-dipeptidase MftE n=1 Tax=Mycolicibacterium sp. CBMA 295 TaxID=2606605 RepID=UPI001308AFAB|nr:mycofactocin biosynthesis peptidyl-dipeptidase MftE [Mycolicibacterium sp. CBMA 295]MUM25247.1 mycofactocin biosynthesis peptidyl-dipeptidase MftE [Mycolicibacterium sp. CBMA 295]